MAETLDPGRNRPRLSLLTLLLLTALFACGITIVQLWRSVAPLRAEVHRLRQYAGELTVKDPTKIHAIELGTDNELLWRWKVWLPPGGDYALHFRAGEITEEGPMPPSPSVGIRETGEQIVEFQIRFDPLKQAWVDEIRVGNLSTGGNRHDWVAWESLRSVTTSLRDGTRAFADGQPAFLARNRYWEGRSTGGFTQEPADGFAIWIERR